MDKGILNEREKAMEANYFRQQDAKLLEQLRKSKGLDEFASALRDILQVDNPDLLERVRGLGITPETAAAFLSAPLAQVAWAEGSVTRKEQEAVLRIAHSRGVEEGSPAEARLAEWLRERPSDALFDTAAEVIKYALDMLPPVEREERTRRIVDACHEVAAASGSELARLIGLGDGVSKSEAQVLEQISTQLRRHEGA